MARPCGATSSTLRANDVGAPELGIDGEIEQCGVAHSPFDLQLGSNRPKSASVEAVAWDQSICPYSMVGGTGLVGGRDVILHGHPPLIVRLTSTRALPAYRCLDVWYRDRDRVRAPVGACSRSATYMQSTSHSDNFRRLCI
jgi:hypothetical protein